MKNILHLFKRDVQNVSRSVIGLVVVMGLIIVPCLYAWFNIAGSWDPYGNTGNLKKHDRRTGRLYTRGSGRLVPPAIFGAALLNAVAIM